MDEQIEMLQTIAMQIIICAGDAKTMLSKGLDAMTNLNYEEAKSLFEEAQQAIWKAHQTQTDVIQQEADKGGMPYSILFCHAQDTLMVTRSELFIAQKLLKIAEGIEHRIRKIEEVNS